MSAGAVKLTVALALPARALTPVGEEGAVGLGNVGVTWLLAAEGTLVPAAFVAVTVKVYAVAFVSPLTVMGEVVPVAVMPSGLLLTV